MSMITIDQFKVNTEYHGVYLVSEVNVKTKTQPPYDEYLNVVLQDATGKIAGNIWPNQKERGDQEKWDAIKEAKALDVKVIVRNWKDLKVLDFVSLPEPVALRDVESLNEMVPKSYMDPDTAMQRLLSLIDDFTDPALKQVAKDCLKNHQEEFLSYPAAMIMHHAYLGGLATHTLGVANAARSIANLYPEPEEIDMDLLVTGAIAHDIEKFHEYQLNDFGLFTGFSVEGHLLGHHYMGGLYLKELCEKYGVSEEKTLLLQHMILSHHGKPEYGSSIQPKTLEAEILYLADFIDSRLEIFRHQFSTQEKGIISQRRILGLDNQFIYRKKEQ